MAILIIAFNVNHQKIMKTTRLIASTHNMLSLRVGEKEQYDASRENGRIFLSDANSR
jgi:hypothetical protein